MKTAQTKSQRARNAGAVICALLLCVGMVALLASLGTNSAHAEGSAGEGLAATSETITTNELVGYYATGTNNKLDGSGTIEMSGAGVRGYNTSGVLVSLRGLDIQGTSAYIAADKLGSFLGSTGLRIFRTPDTSLGTAISWYALYTTTTVEKPTETKPTTSPDAESDRGDSSINDNVSAPETPKEEAGAPTQPTSPAPESTRQPDSSASDSPLLSLQCHKSEVESKVVELESRGYEIVRIQEEPYWLR